MKILAFITDHPTITKILDHRAPEPRVSSARIFHRLLLEALVGDGNHARLGDAVLAAQSAYAASRALPEMIAIYHLFGDPAMTVQ